MTDGDALLRAIEANLAEDTPRLAYADWLDEHAESDAQRARAEFIRLQCQMARGVLQNVSADERRADQSRYAALEWRAKELEEAHGKSWLGELPGHHFNKRFHRGFLEPMWLSAADFALHWQTLAARAPIGSMRFFQTPNSVGRIAACPGLEHIRRLNLTSNVIRVSHVRALMASPHFTNLKAINFESNHVGLGGCKALASAMLPSLESLVLDMNVIGDRGLTALLEAPWLPRLKRLSVRSCGLRGPGIAALARAKSVAGLESLNLSGTRTTPPETIALLAGGAFTNLQSLILFDTSVNDGAVISLAASAVFANLRHLDIAGTPTGERAVRAVLDSPHLRNLESIRVNGDALNDAARAALAARFRNKPNPTLSPDEW